MKALIFLLMSAIEVLSLQPIFSQVTLVTKTIDTTHQSVVAISRVDTLGNPWILASGVLIHPQVILTAGHVNYRTASSPFFINGCIPEGFVSFGNNVLSSKVRFSFNWVKDVESHPDTACFGKSLTDTTGLTNPYMFIDLGLIFLSESVYDIPISLLPKAYNISNRRREDFFLGAGYGYFRTVDSTYKPGLMDGFRRQWSFKNIIEINDLWISVACDSVTKLPYISVHDSGAPLFMGDNLVVGIWSFADDAQKPCPYTSCAIRIDNPKVLAWIKETIKTRLGIDLN
jgi:hypothetical protein